MCVRESMCVHVCVCGRYCAFVICVCERERVCVLCGYVCVCVSVCVVCVREGE